MVTLEDEDNTVGDSDHVPEQLRRFLLSIQVLTRTTTILNAHLSFPGATTASLKYPSFHPSVFVALLGKGTSRLNTNSSFKVLVRYRYKDFLTEHSPISKAPLPPRKAAWNWRARNRRLAISSVNINLKMNDKTKAPARKYICTSTVFC